MLADALAVDGRAVSAILITQDITALVVTIDRGVEARDRQILKEDLAFAAAPDAHALFAQFKRAPRLFALADDDIGSAAIGAHCRTGRRLIGCGTVAPAGA